MTDINNWALVDEMTRHFCSLTAGEGHHVRSLQIVTTFTSLSLVFRSPEEYT